MDLVEIGPDPRNSLRALLEVVDRFSYEFVGEVVGVREQEVGLVEFFYSASGCEVHFGLVGCYGLVVSLLEKFFLHSNSLNFIYLDKRLRAEPPNSAY